MIDYDVVVMFHDRTTETIHVAAINPVRAIQTAVYRMERWEKDKQATVNSLSLFPPAKRMPIVPVTGHVRPQLNRRPAA